jgi:tripeptide aminopeptidase
VKLTSICCIFLVMATLSARAADESIEKLAQDPTCARAIEWIDKNAAWVTDQQIRLTEIPAPEFKEARRGDALRKLFEANGLRVRVDKIGNVIGERPGSSSKDVVLLVAHLDTVFPTGTNVTVKHNASRLEAPGISDNGAGLAALIGVSRALSEGRVRTTKTLVFAGDVGEEGEGNLRGIRALVDDFGA